MISCQRFHSFLKDAGFCFFTGVPCSCFKSWIDYLSDHEDDLEHIIAANEGEALAVGTGYHLATKEIPVIYLQNDGLGNMFNPLTSLVDSNVYGIPAILLISWRGAPKLKDAPQHTRMGEITHDLLDLLEIPFYSYDGDNNALKSYIEKGVDIARKEGKPYAIILTKGDLKSYSRSTPSGKTRESKMSREEAIRTIVERLDESVLVVSTTGRASRELFEYRVEHGEDPGRDFLNIGAMGCASSIALGIAKHTDRNVVVLDGDGAALMRMEALATIGHYQPPNYYHFILDNQCHDSTGGQKTVSATVDFCMIARAVGYRYAIRIESKVKLKEILQQLLEIAAPALFSVRVKKGARKNLGRPTISPLEMKKRFLAHLSSKLK